MEHTLIGNFRVHSGFHSRFLKSDRDVIVYLPPGYEDSPDRRYPVCYLHDGQNLFDAATAFLGREWGLDELVEQMIRDGEIEPLILAGIYNTGEKRIDEHTHIRDRNGRGGLAGKYGRLIVEELKPMIDREYRTWPNAENTGLGGSSLGGLASLYIGFRHPMAFGKLIVMSPSLWWAQRDILHCLRTRAKQPQQKIWLDVGACEGTDPGSCVQDARDLRDLLLSRQWILDGSLKFVEEEGAEHIETAWGRRMREALRFLFPNAARFDGNVP
ncbi:MAG: alpha/beta hydrolase-fold protein [Acidobacteriota bacterium]|nr:alpha/beta hydrolase-fold protein [Acidobacteriota bacterium]